MKTGLTFLLKNTGKVIKEQSRQDRPIKPIIQKKIILFKIYLISTDWSGLDNFDMTHKITFS